MRRFTFAPGPGGPKTTALRPMTLATVRRLLPLLLALLALGLAPAAARAADRPVAIFYYPWWGTPRFDGKYAHWSQNGHVPPFDLASGYYPARGAYSSSDRAVVAAQMADIAGAGVDEVVASWWGWGSPEDLRLQLLLRAAHAHGLDVSVQIEPYPGRSGASVVRDVGHLRDLGIARFYVYQPGDLPDAEWAAANSALDGVTMLAQTTSAAHAAAGGFDGLYTYDVLLHAGPDFARVCAQAHALRLLCAPSVGPGFDSTRATGDTRVKPRLDGRTYDAMWRAVLRAGADAVTITSYNEWHEGTQIEPARPLATRDGLRLEGYDGAWGLTGRPAQTAYLDRTAYWAGVWRDGATQLASVDPRPR